MRVLLKKQAEVIICVLFETPKLSNSAHAFLAYNFLYGFSIDNCRRAHICLIVRVRVEYGKLFHE